MESLSVCINWRAEEGGTTRRSLKSESNAERAWGEESNNVPVMEKLPKEFLALSHQLHQFKATNHQYVKRTETIDDVIIRLVTKYPKKPTALTQVATTGRHSRSGLAEAGSGITLPPPDLPKELGSG